MWKYTHTDELYHYGVPGMKWGQRKARYTSGSGQPSNIKRVVRRPVSASQPSAASQFKKSASTMINKIREARLRKQQQAASNPSGKQIKRIRRKSLDQLTNTELQAVNNRLQLEQNYRDLAAKKSIGKKVVGFAIGTLTVTAATQAAQVIGRRAAEKAMDKLLKK